MKHTVPQLAIRDGADGSNQEARATGGEIFGPWLLGDALGSGGWARVYRASPNTSGVATGRPVAIKRPIRVDDISVRRLAEEGRVTASISSPHVVEVLEVNIGAADPHLVLELVDGIDLATLIHRVMWRRQLLPTEAIVTILKGVALALRDAHQATDAVTGEPAPILHGDVKPSNVLLGKDGVVKLADFGAAQQGGWHPAATATVLGTLAYVAPERVRPGDRPVIDPRSDLFSLGAIAYELCTLKPLFTGKPSEILQQHIEADGYVKTVLRSLPPHVQPQMRRLLRGLLAPQPDDRFPTAAAVIERLDALQGQMKLSIDLADFISPYLGGESFIHQDVRITRELPGVSRRPILPGKAYRPITALSPAEALGLSGKPARPLIGPRAMAAARDEASQRGWLIALVLLLVTLGSALLLWLLVPIRLDISTQPVDAMVEVQPGCEGPFLALQPAPFPYHHSGPWPICFRFFAPGHVDDTVRVNRPSFLKRATGVGVTLQEEACVAVSSRPARLPIFIENRYRGETGVQDTLVCGLRPYTPYVVQLEHKGARWDVQEILAEPGAVVKVFQDFGWDISVTTSPLQRCQRYHREGQFERAVELCRIAVVESAPYTDKVDALILQADARQALGQPAEACSLLYHALGIAVEYRNLNLESRIQDLRAEQNCDQLDEILAAQAEREKKAAKKGDEAKAADTAPEDNSEEAEAKGDETKGDEADNTAPEAEAVPEGDAP